MQNDKHEPALWIICSLLVSECTVKLSLGSQIMRKVTLAVSWIFFVVTFALLGTAAHSRSASAHSISRSSSGVAHSSRLTRSHHNNSGIGFPWIGPGGIYYSEPSKGEHQNLPSDISVNLPPSNTHTEIDEIRIRNANPGYYTFYPIHLGCAQQTVTAPWNNGKPHTVNVVRC